MDNNKKKCPLMIAGHHVDTECIEDCCALFGSHRCALAEISSAGISDSIGVMESTLGEIGEALRNISKTLYKSL